MPNKKDEISIGVFPAPTLSQLECILEERQKKDRRKNTTAIDFKERRKRHRRTTDNL